MLKIFNNLEPFFNDCYRRINVREYARLRKISPPSASQLLKDLKKENLLIKEKERNYIYYAANIKDSLFIDLSRIYWSYIMKRVGIVERLKNEMISQSIILFGSLSKAEAKHNSDLDIAIFTTSKKQIDLSDFEKKLKRKIQVIMFKEMEDVKNKDLLGNILNGHIISGGW